MTVALGASSGWTIGLVLGVVVVIVAAAIVITIVALAMRIAKQAETAVGGVEQGARADRRAGRRRADQRLRGPDPALGAGAAQGGGGQMTVLAALSNHGAWGIALIIGLVAALAVAALLAVLIRTVRTSTGRPARCSRSPAQVAANTANIPQLQATAPVLGQIVEEAVVQDGYMNALTDGFGGRMSATTLTILSVLLAVVIVAVLAGALILIRQASSPDLGQARHAGRRAGGRRVRAPAPARARRQGDQRPVRRDRRRVPRDRRQGGDRGREEARMTLEWIGDVILLVVVLPVVIYLLRGVLDAANGIVPSVRPDRRRGPGRLGRPRRHGAAADHPGAGDRDGRRRSPTTAARST